MNVYSIELSYNNGCQYLSVKGRSEWKDKRTALKHARDVASLKCAPSILPGLFAISVFKNDWHLIERIEVSQ